MGATREEVELLAREYVEELIGAGFGKYVNAVAMCECVTNLVASCFDEREREALRPSIVVAVELLLLIEPTKGAAFEVDAETVRRLRKSLR